MAREVLSNGVIVPEKYTRDWFDDFRTNLVKLNDAITAIAGKQNALTQEQLDAVNSAITSQKVTAYDDHIADTSKHLTDGTASKAIADEDGTSIKTGYVNVAGNQTVAGDKSWTGSNTFNNILPNATSTYSLGSSSYQWSSVYAQSYYYNGTAWGLDKYNTWTNSQAYKLTGTEIGSTTSGYISLSFIDKNNNNLGLQRASVYSDGRTCFSWKIYNTDNNSQSINTSLEYYISKAGVKVFAPVENATTDLGTSTNKWKTLNGINPGALSLPSLNYSQWIDIRGNIIQLTGGDNWYYPTMGGWVFVITNGNPVSLNVLVLGAVGSGKSIAGASGVLETSSGAMWVSCPASAGSRVRIRADNGSTGALGAAWFIPCEGNV